MVERLITEIKAANYNYFIREHSVIFCHGSATCLGPLESLSRVFSEL